MRLNLYFDEQIAMLHSTQCRVVYYQEFWTIKGKLKRDMSTLSDLLD